MATQAQNPADVAATALTATHELTVMLAHAQAPPQVLKALQGCTQVLTAVVAALHHSEAAGPAQPDSSGPATSGAPATAAPAQAAGPSTPSSRDQAMQAASQHALAAHAAANAAAAAPQ